MTTKDLVFLLCGVSPPHDEALFIREKGPKPCSPGRGPSALLRTGPAGCLRRRLEFIDCVTGSRGCSKCAVPQGRRQRAGRGVQCKSTSRTASNEYAAGGHFPQPLPFKQCSPEGMIQGVGAAAPEGGGRGRRTWGGGLGCLTAKLGETTILSSGQRPPAVGWRVP